MEFLQNKSSFFDGYEFAAGQYDEVFEENSLVRGIYQDTFDRINKLSSEGFSKLFNEAKTSFFNQGITFAVYSDKKNATEKIFPFHISSLSLLPIQEQSFSRKK